VSAAESKAYNSKPKPEFKRGGLGTKRLLDIGENKRTRNCHEDSGTPGRKSRNRLKKGRVETLVGMGESRKTAGKRPGHQ